MFIEKIQIEGMESFGISSSIVPFFPGINILVEDCASRETSIFTAIEFLFNDEYPNKEKFNELFSNNTHEGNKNSINVEIFFDNSDKKYSGLPSRFSIKRTTTTETDVYTFCEKTMARREFVDLVRRLNMGVFTYISTLKQSKVIEFAMASNEKRLDLLRKMIGNHKLNRENCCEQSEIKKEKLKKLKEKITPLQKKLEDWQARQRKEKLKFDELTNELKISESKLIRADRHFQLLRNIKKEETSMINELENLKNLLETFIFNSKKNNIERESTFKKIHEELEYLNKEIASEEKTVESMESELSLLKANVEEIKAKYQEELWELDYLYVKLSKDHEPVSEEKREQSIRKIMADWQDSFSRKRKYQEDYPRQREEKIEKRMESTENISLIKTELGNLKTSQENHSKELEVIQGKIKTTADASKFIVMKKEEVSKRLRLLQDNYEENRKKLMVAVNCDVMYNKTVIENALQSFNEESKNIIDVSSYHRFAIDCFQCPPEVEVAVLAVAGQRLFHFVFDSIRDTIKISRKIGNEHNLSFISLNCLSSTYKTLPNSSDAFPLITKITYEPAYEKLIQSMFSNILVCRNDQAASDLSKKHKVTCVTLHGNMFLPGDAPFIRNCNGSGINPVSIYKLMSDQLKEIENKKKEINEFIEEELSAKKTIEECLEQIKVLKSKEKQNELQRISLETKLHELEFELLSFSIESDEHNNIEDSMNILSMKVKEFELKLCNVDQEKMTPEDNRRYEELKVSTADLLKLWGEAEKKADELNKKITLKLDALQETYVKWRNDLMKKGEEINEAKEKENELIKDYERNLESKVLMLESEYKRRNEQQTEVENLKKEIEDLTIIKNQQKNEVQELKLSIDKNDEVTKDLESKYNEIRKLLEEILPDFQLQERVYNQFAVINDNLDVIVDKFIPFSHAQLIFMINNQQYTVNEAKDLDLECFTGVDIKFFESEDLPAQSMNVISIKQRMIITLALFLAIQKSNLTPIVLCDRIDGIFNSNHQKILATIIKEMSSNAQIFLNTSQSEVMKVGDNFVIV